MTKKRCLVWAAVLMISVLGVACHPVIKLQPEVVTDVYVAGGEANAAQFSVAKYWKNGTAVSLTDGTNGAMATFVFVSGTDVYVAGEEASGPGGTSVAKYWKNGVPIALTDGTRFAFANSIFVSGNDVYVAGGEYSVAGYWKNGVFVPLTDGTQTAQATSIYVSEAGVVHVAGFEYTNKLVAPGTYLSNPVAKYWKNGVAVELTPATQKAQARSIFVTGTNDIYVAGYGYWLDVPGPFATFWKNVAPVTLSDKLTQANSIFVSGNDVYVAGMTNAAAGVGDVAELWKNGVPTALTDGSTNAAANQVTVSGGDVYVAGYEGAFAKYWKNGVSVALTDGKQWATATSIAVVTRQN